MGRGSKPRYVWTKMFISEEQQWASHLSCPQARDQKNKIKLNIRKIGKRGLNSVDLIDFRFFFFFFFLYRYILRYTYIHVNTQEILGGGFFRIAPILNCFVVGCGERETLRLEGLISLSLSLSLSCTRFLGPSLSTIPDHHQTIIILIIIIPFLPFKSLTS